MLDEDPMPVLECFMRNKRPLTLARLNDMTRLNVHVLSHLLAVLERAGLIWQCKTDDDSGLEVITYGLRNAAGKTYVESDDSAECNESKELDDLSEQEKPNYHFKKLLQKSIAGHKRKSRELSIEVQRLLIEGLKSNDQNCKTVLYEHYSLWIMGIAHSICHDQDKLHDLIQVGLEAFFKWIPNFDADKGISLTAFSYRRVRGSS